MAYEGGCQCGATRYRAEGPVQAASVCYCSMCQRAAGAPFMALFRLRAEDVTWSAPPAIFASSSMVERGFCRACGTPLTYRAVAGPNVSLTIYSLDDPALVTPTTGYESGGRPGWCETLAMLPDKPFDLTGKAGFVTHQRRG